MTQNKNSPHSDTPETDSQFGSLANAPDDTSAWMDLGLPRGFERERNKLAGYLCRIKLPLPVRFVAELANVFPGKNIRMKDEGGYLCIFPENDKSDSR